MKKKVKILGAGPSGLVAGINLAKAGHKVTIFEKNKTCGSRFNNDLQGLENWSQKKDILDDLNSMGIETSFPAKPCKRLEVYDSENNHSVIDSNRSMFYLVRRGIEKGCLDQSLKEQALENRVNIKFNTLADEKDCDIIASGPKIPFGIARGISFNTKMRDMAIGFLDDDIAPKGYAYLITSNGHGCLVTVLFRQFRSAEACYQRLTHKVKSIMKLNISRPRKFTGYGSFSLAKRYTHNGKIYIGESSGLQDILWGFGMRYAMTSGYLAAKSIIEDLDAERLFRERFESQLKTSMVNRYLFEKLGNKGYKFFIDKAKKTKEPTEFLYRHYNSSLIKKIIFPWAKLRLKSMDMR